MTDRFRRVAVGELAHAVGGHHVEDVVRGTFLLQRTRLTLAFAAHDDGTKLDDFAADREFDARRRLIADGDGLRYVTVSQIRRHDGVGAGWDVADREFTLAIRDGLT